MATRVARYQADRTNQKLYFVRLCCQSAEQADNTQVKICHIESAMFHLYGSYLAFIQEVAHYYNLNQAEPTLESISQALAQKTQISPEVVRLQRLVNNDFLGEIITAWQQIQYKSPPNFEEKSAQIENTWATNVQRLPMVDVMASSSLTQISVSSDMIRQWREQLLLMIETLRESMVEF